MIRTKVAAVAFGAALGLGTVAATALPAMASSGPSAHEVETTVPGGGTTTLTLAGIGDITVTIDATTGEISDVSLAAVDGVTLDSQTTLPNGNVQLDVTLADGTQQSVIVSGEIEDGVPAVEAEIEHPEGDDDESEDESEHDGDDDDHDEDGEHATPPGTGTAPSPGVPSHGEDDDD